MSMQHQGISRVPQMSDVLQNKAHGVCRKGYNIEKYASDARSSAKNIAGITAFPGNSFGIRERSLDISALAVRPPSRTVLHRKVVSALILTSGTRLIGQDCTSQARGIHM